MVSLQVYQPSATGMSEEIKDTDCGWSGQVFVVMFSTDGGSCERRKETQVIPAKCDDSSTRTTAISYIFLPVVNWSTCTHRVLIICILKRRNFTPYKKKNRCKRMRDLYSSTLITEFCCSGVIYFWRGKKCKELGAHTKYLLIKGCLSFHESHVMDEIYELESASKDLQHSKLVMTSSRLWA